MGVLRAAWMITRKDLLVEVELAAANEVARDSKKNSKLTDKFDDIQEKIFAIDQV